MNENIRKFLEKAAQDSELAAKLNAIKTPDEAYALASSVQGGFTKEEFVSTMEQLKASADNASELTDEDISKMAGGTSIEEIASLAASGAASALVASAAAYAAAI